MCQDHVHQHGHGHNHLHHMHDDGDAQEDLTLAEKNRDFWEDKVQYYDKEEWQKKLLRYTSEQLLEHLDVIKVNWTRPDESPEAKKGKQVRVLDYACGPGTISSILAPYVTEIRGVDISPAMIKAYNARFSTPSTPHIQEAIVGDLVSPSPPSPAPQPPNAPPYTAFDLAVVGYALHHFEAPALALSRLTARVKPGTGIVFVIDLLPFDIDGLKQHEAAHTIHARGFSEEEVKALFSGAGLTDCGMSVLKETVEMGKGGTHKVFFAWGRRGEGNGESL